MFNLAQRYSLERRAAITQIAGAGLSLSDFDKVLDSMFGGFPVWSGATVSQQSALTTSTLWACVAAIADDIATLPTLPYRKRFDKKGKPDGRELATDHYLYPLLMLQVNPELSAFRFFQLMQVWLLLWGNAYAELNINGRGQVTELWPWRPDRTHVSRFYETGPLQYQYRMRDGNLSKPVDANHMLHLRGMGIDGILGMNPVDTQKQNIGLSLAQTEHGARYFGQGTKMGGIVQSPLALSDKAWERLKKTLSDEHQGLSNAHRLLILEEGLTWQDTTDDMVKSAFVAAQTYTDQQICRFMKVPLHRVGLNSGGDAGDLETLSTGYVLYTLAPWCANWQNQIHCDMLSTRENQTIYTSFDFTNLLRGNHKDMSQFIAALADRGMLNADEVREKFLDMNPLPDGLGQDFYRAINMGIIGDEGEQSLKSPANATTVQKIQKKQPPADDDAEPPRKKQNGHAALHALNLSDNTVEKLMELLAQNRVM